MFKKHVCILLILVLVMLIVFAGIIVIVDPFFHYHEPNEIFGYIFCNARYQNYGIAKNFDYDAIITGTSMTENFKSTEFDELFDVTSIKTSFSGEALRGISDYLKFALNENSEVKYVITSLDFYSIMSDKNALSYSDYPTYLYDYNILNDVNYVLNKSVMLSVVSRVLMNTQVEMNYVTTFDEYTNWSDYYSYGIEAVLNTYERGELSADVHEFTEGEKNAVYDNLQQNIVSLALENPSVEFYLFIPPYSIAWFDSMFISGEMQKNIEVLEYVTSILLECENVNIYSFFDEYEMICNLDNYKDTVHYNEDINSQILIWMHNEEHLLASDNYEEYFNEISDFYLNYDYDAIWE
ncbi:MAG: hypothetical protein R3Y65_05915 [Bacillota bacterium]